MSYSLGCHCATFHFAAFSAASLFDTHVSNLQVFHRQIGFLLLSRLRQLQSVHRYPRSVHFCSFSTSQSRHWPQVEQSWRCERHLFLTSVVSIASFRAFIGSRVALLLAQGRQLVQVHAAFFIRLQPLLSHPPWRRTLSTGFARFLRMRLQESANRSSSSHNLSLKIIARVRNNANIINSDNLNAWADSWTAVLMHHIVPALFEWLPLTFDLLVSTLVQWKLRKYVFKSFHF